MSKALRLSETWLRRGLWAVALVFAWFLIGLGGTIVGDLPKVEQRPSSWRTSWTRRPRRRASRWPRPTTARRARASTTGWPRATPRRAEQDAELIERTARLDQLRRAEREALAAVEAQQQIALDARQATARAQARLAELETQARERLDRAWRAQKLRIFLYRLMFTLPLLAAAGWLFARRRGQRACQAGSRTTCSSPSMSITYSATVAPVGGAGSS